MSVEYFEDVNTAPINRFVKFNSLMALSASVGSTLDDMQKRDHNVIAFLKANDIQSALQELQNKSLTKHFLKSGYTPSGHALAVMVKSIDGVERTDISEKGLQDTLDLLSKKGFSKNDIDTETDNLKKKSITSFVSTCLTRLKQMLGKTYT